MAAVPDYDAENADLEAQIAALDDQIHDAEAEIAATEEHTHSADAAEERLTAEREHVAELKAKLDADEDVAASLESKVAGCGDMPAEYARLRALEEEIHDSDFKDLWELTVQADDLAALAEQQGDNLLSEAEFKQKIDEDAALHKKELERAAEVKRSVDAAREEAAKGNEAIVAELDAQLRVELPRLQALKAKLTTLLSEQRFHLRRGTHMKPSVYTRSAKDEFLELTQLKTEHDKACAAINEQKWHVEQLRRAVRDLSAELKLIRKDAKAERVELEAKIDALKKELETVEWDRERAAQENAELRELRRDTIRAQAQVRHALK